MKRSTQVVRFFENHRWLLTDPRFAEGGAGGSWRSTRRSLTQAQASVRGREGRARATGRKARRLAALPRRPRHARRSARVFGSYCGQALAGRALRVGPDDDGPERPVPRAVPDGLERAPPVRARRDRDRAGAGRPPVLRRRRDATGARGPASPGADAPSRDVSCANCGNPAVTAGFPRRPALCYGCPDGDCSGAGVSACGRSTRRPPTRAAMASATRRCGS